MKYADMAVPSRALHLWRYTPWARIHPTKVEEVPAASGVRFNVVEGGQRKGGPLAPIEAVYDLLNSAPFLAFIRALTGDSRAAYVDAQATRYRPGDFLTAHDDDVEGKNRLFAYVMNFTPAWRADWGGLLAFHDADGHVAEAYTPTFNALNIFRVPQVHAVTQVASFAAGPRLSITGWIRERRP